MDILKSILVPLAVALLSTGLTAYITIKVKFAQDEKAAFRSVTSGLLRFLSYALNVVVVLLLIREAVSPDPVTRYTVLAISIYTTSILFSVVANLFTEIMRMMNRMLDLHDFHLKMSEKSFPVVKDEHK